MVRSVIEISPTDDPTVLRVEFGEGFAASDIKEDFRLTRTNARQDSGKTVRGKLAALSDDIVCQVLQFDGLAYLHLGPKGFSLCVRRAESIPQVVQDLASVVLADISHAQIIARGSGLQEIVRSLVIATKGGRRRLRLWPAK